MTREEVVTAYQVVRRLMKPAMCPKSDYLYLEHVARLLAEYVLNCEVERWP